MINYMKENVPLVVDKIHDVDIRDLLEYVGLSFLTLQIALPVLKVFESHIIMVPIKIMIEVMFSEPRMLN